VPPIYEEWKRNVVMEVHRRRDDRLVSHYGGDSYGMDEIIINQHNALPSCFTCYTIWESILNSFIYGLVNDIFDLDCHVCAGEAQLSPCRKLTLRSFSFHQQPALLRLWKTCHSGL
jgi:hypothetical protein